MKKLLKVLVLTAVAMSIYGVTASAAPQSEQYKLVWSDEFDGTSLDTTIWNYNYGNGEGNPGWGNNELQHYTDSENNVKVENGNLIITARAERDENGKFLRYTSGRLNTSKKASFKYGKIEARIKIPAVRGLWPAFWMLGQNEPKGWPYCGEIDILETWNELHFAQGTVHWENEISKSGRDTYVAATKKMTDKTQWHIYGMNWDEKKIEFTLDNIGYSTFKLDSSDKSELKKEFYFIINCAIGGNLAYFEPSDDFQSAQMLVDYVRVYQRASDHGTMTVKSNHKDKVTAHNVVFKNGNKEISKETVFDGENFSIPTIKKKGYKFRGWYCESSKITDKSRAYRDLVMKPKWEKIKLKKATVKIPKQRYKKYATVKFNAKGKYDGFQVKVGKKLDTTTSKVITFGKFKSGKTYQVKVRTYSVDSRGKKVFGKWSKATKITIK